MALLVCLFVMLITSFILVGMLDTARSQMAAVRNTADYERALYLAGAGVHHAVAEIEADPSWRDDTGTIEFPSGSGNTYQAKAGDGVSGTIVIKSVGIAGDVTRTLQVTLE